MLKKLCQQTIDTVSNWTGYTATRVPLRRASGPDEVTLDLPGYCQLDSYGCGAVAGIMVLKHFKPSVSFTTFNARVSPHPQNGTATRRLVRALRQSGLRVSERHDLTFADLCAAIDVGRPTLVVVHNPGVEDSHWVVVYGYGRKPNRVFLATNGFPFVTNVVPLRRFARLWYPHGNGLVCAKAKRSACRMDRRTA
ncbi:MAG: hypothetical protein RL514_3164 [Verrucomicrobiota bacterium]|jgi:hypothetical protein